MSGKSHNDSRPSNRRGEFALRQFIRHGILVSTAARTVREEIAGKLDGLKAEFLLPRDATDRVGLDQALFALYELHQFFWWHVMSHAHAVCEMLSSSFIC